MNKKKIGIIIIIILALASVWLTYLYISRGETFKFKKFIYKVPNGITMEKATDDTFKIIGEDYEAIIDIFYTELGDIHSQDAIYTALLKENGINAYLPTKGRIKDTDVLCFEKIDVSERLCYLNTFEPFGYEVVLKGNTDIENLDPVIDILIKGRYDTKSDEEYEYWDNYGKLTSNLE